MKISFILVEPVPHFEDLAYRMQRLAELGYAGIELTASHPLGYPVEKVQTLARQQRLSVVSLLSGWSYAQEGLCLARPDAAVRRRAVQRLQEYVGIAARLGAIVVMGLMQGLRSDEPDEAVANERISEGLALVAQTAVEHGTQVVVEPVNHMLVGFNNTAAEAAALVERVGSRGLGYMLDTIHMHVEEHALLDTIQAHGRRIRHFHLCESNGGPFGSGNLDLPRILAALRATGYEHYVSVKIYRKAGWEEAAQSAAEFLRRQGCFGAGEG